MENKQKVVKKQMTFPTALADSIEIKAKKYGFTFPEYVRHLLLNSLELQDSSDVEYADAETEAMIEQAHKEYESGNYVTLKTKEDIENYLASLRIKDE